MTAEINIRTIEAPEELDHSTLHDLIYLTNHLPDTSDMHGSSHTDIQSALETFIGDDSHEAALIIANQDPFGRAVGYVATQIDPSHDTAEITQLAVAPQTAGAREIGNLLIQQVETWGEQHDVDVVVPRDVEFTGRVVGKQVLEVVSGRDRTPADPANYLG